MHFLIFLQYEDYRKDRAEWKDLEIEKAVINNAEITNGKLINNEFRDIEFRNCNFSNTSFENSSIYWRYKRRNNKSTPITRFIIFVRCKNKRIKDILLCSYFNDAFSDKYVLKNLKNNLKII